MMTVISKMITVMNESDCSDNQHNHCNQEARQLQSNHCNPYIKHSCKCNERVARERLGCLNPISVDTISRTRTNSMER